ncbi:PRKR-interacting protein 1 homolog isoform X1 [Patiria miniata]|uniref:PRKR-interacting protein 1 n=1 Tax=Patiria miniata TaxID=46514 RepID=A0A913ZT33_PATMI|nr:PRKR-interacting protein 1 homolog isoform X1 [Patiria miniata]XP_038054773.1 PRKR-interacting protein 1 homolog isoform X1 [Patiria miniata]
MCMARSRSYIETAHMETSNVRKDQFHRKDAKQQLTLPRSAAEKQKIRIEKLMKNPEKPVYIPDKPREWKTREPPEFVRDVMGSSAGAGSGEFHVYRGYRRREYARQMHIHKIAEQEEHETEFQKKLEENQRLAEEKTTKKRNKRMKRKQKTVQKKKQKVQGPERGKTDGLNDGGCSNDDRNENRPNDNEEDEEDEDDAEENCFVIGGK